jgi:hypothetical protein
MESTQNRNESYFKLIEENKLTEQQEAVLRQLQLMPDLTDSELSDYLLMDKNVINGRRNELAEMGLIFASGGKFNKETNRNNTTWRIKIQDSSIQSTQESITCLSNSELNKIFKLLMVANDYQINLIKERLEQLPKLKFNNWS